MSFEVFVCRRGKEPTGPAYIYFDQFARARHIEAYLGGSPPDCELAGHEFEIIEAPTDEPTLTIENLKEAFEEFGRSVGQPNGPTAPSTKTQETKRWWQFWKP